MLRRFRWLLIHKSALTHSYKRGYIPKGNSKVSSFPVHWCFFSPTNLRLFSCLRQLRSRRFVRVWVSSAWQCGWSSPTTRRPAAPERFIPNRWVISGTVPWTNMIGKDYQPKTIKCFKWVVYHNYTSPGPALSIFVDLGCLAPHALFTSLDSMLQDLLRHCQSQTHHSLIVWQP